MALTPGDTYISTLATYISTNSTRLASSPLPQASRRPPASSSSSSYTSYLLPPALYAGTPPKPLALRITPQNLFYLLLRFQAIGLDVGELDVPLGKDVQRAMSLVEVSSAEILRRRRDERRSETGSFRSVAGSMVSGLSLGGWWGTGGKVKDPDADLKLIYSAFTKLPSVVVHAAGLQDEVIEEMAGSGPLDTAVPLKVFKSLQVLEIISLPPSALIVPVSHTLRSLTIRSVESPMNDEEGEWLVPILFGEKEGVLEQRRKERMVGPNWRAGMRSRQPSAASAVMGGVGEDDEDEAEDEPVAADTSTGLKPPPTSSNGALLPSPALLDSNSTLSPSQQLKFPHLSHLALPQLSLLTLPQLPIPSLVSLDLSHNLLLNLPPNLVHFPNLLALNLEGNMINSLRGADQLLPSAPPPSNAPPSAYRAGGTPTRSPRASSSRTGLRVLNLDSNRISNLHGLSGLTTLQRLSLRNNSISESLELSRLTALPTLVDLYVVPNPFLSNAAEEDWRVRLWDGFAREGREESGCPKVDGEGVSWSERRRMKAPFPTDGGALSRRASRAELTAPKSPPIVPVGGTPVQHSRRSSGKTTASRRAGSTMSAEGDGLNSAAPSPPTPASKAKAPPSSYHPPASSQTLSPSSAAPAPRRKRRHRRIVNLDGGEDSGTATGTDFSEDDAAPVSKPSNGTRHQRASSKKKSTAVAAQETLLAATTATSNAKTSSITPPQPSPTTPTSPNHSSLRSPPSSTTRASARRTRVSASVYEPSSASAIDPDSAAGPPSPPHGASSGDEFRKKLEAMRMEVGDSWMRVLSAGGTGAEASPPPSGGEERLKGSQSQAPGRPEEVALAEEVGVTRVVKKVKKKKKAPAAERTAAEVGPAAEGGK